VQSLVDLEALCPACHEVTHMGLAQKSGNAVKAFKHLRQVNQWDQKTAELHTREAFAIGKKRSKQAWILDVTWIKEIGIQLSAESLQQIDSLQTGALQRGGLFHS
jgi:hypothetical protein